MCTKEENGDFIWWWFYCPICDILNLWSQEWYDTDTDLLLKRQLILLYISDMGGQSHHQHHHTHQIACMTCTGPTLNTDYTGSYIYRGHLGRTCMHGGNNCNNNTNNNCLQLHICVQVKPWSPKIRDVVIHHTYSSNTTQCNMLPL